MAASLCATFALGAPARAQEAPAEDPNGPPVIITRAVKALEEGRYAEARDLFKTAYELAPQPKILFALGQCEFNLENFQGAIDYYQKYLDTNPEPEQAALAQQAIGAARARLVAPTKVIEREKPAPTFERRWDLWSTSLVSVGGAAIVVGTIVAIRGYQVGHDTSATTAVLYRDRLDRAKRWQWTGAGVATAGALIVGAAFVRFAVHRVEVAPIAPGPSPGAMGLAVERAW